MLSTLLVVSVISHLWCAARLVGIAHHSFYSVVTTIGVSDMITVAAPPSRIMLWNGTNYCPLLEEVNVSISKYIKNKFVCLKE